MFSDRFWLLKLAGALGALAILYGAGRRIDSDRNLDLSRVAFPPEDRMGTPVQIWAYRVTSLESRGFSVLSGAGPILLLSDQRPPVGSIVSGMGRLVAPREVKLELLQVHRGYAWKRPLNYLISIVVLLAYLLIIRPRFRWRIAEGVFRSRY